MHYQSIILIFASIASIAIAAPTPQSSSAKDNSGGRVVLDGAQCNPVQGRLVCDDGFGNTLWVSTLDVSTRWLLSCDSKASPMILSRHEVEGEGLVRASLCNEFNPTFHHWEYNWSHLYQLARSRAGVIKHGIQWLSIIHGIPFDGESQIRTPFTPTSTGRTWAPFWASRYWLQSLVNFSLHLIQATDDLKLTNRIIYQAAALNEIRRAPPGAVQADIAWSNRNAWSYFLDFSSTAQAAQPHSLLISRRHAPTGIVVWIRSESHCGKSLFTLGVLDYTLSTSSALSPCFKLEFSASHRFVTPFSCQQ